MSIPQADHPLQTDAPPHIIEELLFDINFNSEELARSEQNALASFAKGKLIEAIQEVLSAQAIPDCVVRIDRLEIDLGAIDYADYRQSMLEQVKSQLGEALRDHLVAGGRQDTPGIRRMNPSVKDFESLCYFLVHGRLPWTSPLRGAKSPQALMADVLEREPGRLLEFLRATARQKTVLTRLARQFPEAQLEKLARAAKGGADHNTTGTHGAGYSGHEPSAMLEALLVRPEKMYNPSSLAGTSSAAGILAEALVSGCIDQLAGIWTELISSQRELVTGTILRHGMHAAVRRRMAESFSEIMLMDMARLLEPQDHGFIETLAGCKELFLLLPPEHSDTGSARTLFWEFTLNYLILERGPVFNRHSFLERVLSQMASRTDAHPHDLIRNFYDTIEGMDNASPVSRQISTMLTHVAQTNNIDLSGQHSQRDDKKITPDTKKQLQEFEKALAERDYITAVDLWPELAEAAPGPLRDLLRARGLHAGGRRRMAEEFPEWLLKKTAVLFEPQQHSFIEEITSRPELFRQAYRPRHSAKTVKARLWEFTLTYLLVDRGSDFNRQDYLRSVLRQMASHSNVSLQEFIVSLRLVLECMEADTQLKKQIISVLTQISKSEGFMLSPQEHSQAADSTTELFRRFEAALSRGDFQTLSGLWQNLAKKNPGVLRAIIRRGILQMTDRRRMAQDFPEALLKEILLLLEPLEAGFIEETISKCAAHISGMLPDLHTPDELRSFFWEFTLTCLIVEQDGMFNKRHYLENMLRRLASQDVQRYHKLLHEIRAGIMAGDVKSSTGHVLLSLIHNLAEKEDASGNTPENQPAQNNQADSQLVKGYAMLDILQNRLWHGPAGADIDIDTVYLLDELACGHPVQFLLFLRHSIERWLDGSSALPSPELLEILMREYARQARLNAGTADTLCELMLLPASAEGHMGLALFGRLLKNPAAEADRLALEMTDRIQKAALRVDYPEQPLAKTATAANVPPAIHRRAMPTQPDEYPQEILAEQLKAAMHNTVSATRMPELLRYFLTHHPAQLPACLRETLKMPGSAPRMAQILPDGLLSRMLALLQPGYYQRLGELADVLDYAMTGLYETGAGVTPGALKWEFMLQYFAVHDTPPDETHFMRGMIAFLEKQMGKQETTAWYSRLRRNLAQAAGALPVYLVQYWLDQPEMKTGEQDTQPIRIHHTPIPMENAAKEEDITQPVFILNAGGVLAAAYLPRLFQSLGLLDQGRFMDASKAERAVHLLQFLICGRSNAPEHELMLNKILCGLAPHTPVTASIDITTQEQQLLESLLQAMITNWPVLGSTSIAGLRESFLQREGRLIFNDGIWHLLVQPMAFDMLLDRLPWSYSMIRHSWMEHAVQVEWRHGL